jgi:hypothetical protein
MIGTSTETGISLSIIFNVKELAYSHSYWQARKKSIISFQGGNLLPDYNCFLSFFLAFFLSFVLSYYVSYKVYISP